MTWRDITWCKCNVTWRDVTWHKCNVTWHDVTERDMSAISDLVAELHFLPAAGSWICNGLTRTAEPSVTRATPLEQHVSQVPVRQCQWTGKTWEDTMNSFRFSLDQEKSFPSRIGSVPQQEQCFPWASGPRETLFCLGTLPLYSGMKFLGLVKTLINSWVLPPFSYSLYHTQCY